MSQRGYGYYNVISWDRNGSYQKYPLNILNKEFVNQEFDYLLFLKLENDQYLSIPNVDQLIGSLRPILNMNKTTFVILTPRREPPLTTASEDEYVFSFACHFQYLKEVIIQMDKSNLLSTELLFDLLDQIINQNSAFEGLIIKQFPFELEKSIAVPNYNVIIPHRGNNRYLRNLLSFIKQPEENSIYVGIDQDITEDVAGLKTDYSNTSFYHFSPSPAGPYVIRNNLIDQCDADLIIFQDSDDIPCIDRFEKLSYHMHKNGCQMCGSHELRLDYYQRVVQAIRFPLDVMNALETAPQHPLLHPTSAILRKAFYDCGRLSEERVFANDTKFLLNSFFILESIKNLNEFLYIRTKHPNSLTTSPDTMIGSTVRNHLLETWNDDFTKIKSGILNLENSSLQFEKSKLNYIAVKC